MFCLMIPQVNQLLAFTCHLLIHHKLVGTTSEEHTLNVLCKKHRTVGAQESEDKINWAL